MQYLQVLWTWKLTWKFGYLHQLSWLILTLPPSPNFWNEGYNLHDLISKHLKLYYVLLEMYYYQTFIYSFWWELSTVPSSAETVVWAHGLVLPLNTLVISVLVPIQTSEAVIKEQLSLRPRMAKGETSGNLLLLSGYEAWRLCFMESGVALKDMWMKRTEDASCSNL